jgi:hypothetical protein
MYFQFKVQTRLLKGGIVFLGQPVTYVIPYIKREFLFKFQSYLPMVGGSLRVLRLIPPLKTGRHDIVEILLKVALNTKNQSIKFQFVIVLPSYDSL